MKNGGVRWQEKLEKTSRVQDWQKDFLKVPGQERLEKTSLAQDWQKDFPKVQVGKIERMNNLTEVKEGLIS